MWETYRAHQAQFYRTTTVTEGGVSRLELGGPGMHGSQKKRGSAESGVPEE